MPDANILCYLIWVARPHRLAARTWPSQGQNTGSIPVGAMDGNRTGVRFPFLRIPLDAISETELRLSDAREKDLVTVEAGKMAHIQP